MWRESRRRVNSLHRLQCERTQRERRRSLVRERGITPIDRVRRPTVMVAVARGEVGVLTGLPTVTVEPPGSSVSFFTAIHSLFSKPPYSFSLPHDGRRLPAECASGVPLFSAHCTGADGTVRKGHRSAVEDDQRGVSVYAAEVGVILPAQA